MKPARRTQRDLLAVGALQPLWTIGMSTFARLSVSLRPSCSVTPSRTVVPARPLISAVDWSDVLPASGLPLTATITSPALQAALLGRRAVVDLLDAQALLTVAHGHPDALELALGVELEVVVVARREVVRELVLERFTAASSDVFSSCLRSISR